MDLMDMGDCSLYFDQPLPASVELLIQEAAESYHLEQAEYMLLAAYMILPHHLTIHVALYRYYYYKHRLAEAMLIAERTIQDAGAQLGYDGHWRDATLAALNADADSMVMVRYYLMALKGSGLIALRMGQHDDGLQRLRTVIAMDAEDRLGTQALLDVVLAAE